MKQLTRLTVCTFLMCLFSLPGFSNPTVPSIFMIDGGPEEIKEEALACKGYICYGPFEGSATMDPILGPVIPIYIGVAFRPGTYGDREWCNEHWQLKGDKTWKKVGDVWGDGCEIFHFHVPKPGKYTFRYRVQCMDFKTGEVCEVITTKEIEVKDRYGRWKEINDRSPIQVEQDQPSITPFQLSPNPSQGNLRLQFDLNAEAPVNVQLYNSNGQVVFQELHSGVLGANTISLNVDGQVAPGFYTVQVVSGSKTFIARAVIQ